MTTTTNAPKQQPDTILTGRRINDRGLRSRPRRKGLAAFAAFMMLGSGVAVAVMVDRAGDTVEVLAVRESIAKGHTITRGDLVAKDVAGIDETYSVDAAAAVVGSSATVDLVPGQVITRDMVSKTPTPAAGKATVGLNLDPTRVPAAGLKAGDVVDVIAVPAGDNTGGNDELDAPPALASAAQVYDTAGTATEGGGVLVTIIVDKSAAARIAAYSTADRVAIVETATATGSGAS